MRRLLILAPLLLLVGCAPTPSAHDPIAVFEVAGQETYMVELATPELVQHAHDLLDGRDVAAIPLGTVVRDDPGVNAPWSWHIDPATLEFADQAIEVCDGLPSYVEDGTVTSDTYCPWSAKVVDILYEG
jgi:hypothetical protein